MQEIKLFDLHCDTVDSLSMTDVEPFSSFGATSSGDLFENDRALAVDRMRQVASWAQCFAIWIPDCLTSISPLAFYRRARDYFHKQIARHTDAVAQIRDARELDGVLDTGKVAALLTVEGGSPLGTDLSLIDEFACDGVKMVTLTWNGPNAIASGHDTTEGLSAFGREVVRTLEDRHIVVDVSHLNDVGFWDLMKVVQRPIAASHSNLRAVCGHQRNLTDDQFRAIADGGGIVGLNYCIEFVRDEARVPSDVSFEDMAAHIERFLDLGGERAIALGSDFDGCTTPDWLNNCEKVTGFYQQMVDRFGKTIADRLFFENAHDFFVRNETA